MLDDQASSETNERNGTIARDAKYIRELALAMSLIITAMLVLLLGQAVSSEPDIVFSVLASLIAFAAVWMGYFKSRERSNKIAELAKAALVLEPDNS